MARTQDTSLKDFLVQTEAGKKQDLIPYFPSLSLSDLSVLTESDLADAVKSEHRLLMKVLIAKHLSAYLDNPNNPFQLSEDKIIATWPTVEHGIVQPPRVDDDGVLNLRGYVVTGVLRTMQDHHLYLYISL